MELSRQEYWSGLPFPTPGNLPDPGIKPAYLASPAFARGFFTTVSPGLPALLNVLFLWRYPRQVFGSNFVKATPFA